MTSLQKESEWESELKELLEKQGVDITEDGGHQIFDEQVALIIRIISNREKEIAEEVEEIQTKLHNGHLEAGYKLTNKLLSILKH